MNGHAYVMPEREATDAETTAAERHAAAVNNAFRTLAQAALRFASVAAQTLPDEALRLLADAAQRGARLGVRVSVPDLASARLLLIEPEGAEHLVAEIVPRTPVQ